MVVREQIGNEESAAMEEKYVGFYWYLSQCLNNILQSFLRVSRLKINWNKTNAVLAGATS